MNPRWQKTLKDYAEALIIALVLAFFIKSFVVQAFKIPSGSMLETLQIGDHLLVNKFTYGVKVPFTNKFIFDVGDPEHGDIVVFKYPVDTSTDFIKRVIGVPGDRIAIKDKKLIRNGELVSEDYTQFTDPRILSTCAELPQGESWTCPCRDNIDEFTVPEGKYFCMGDNRDGSKDSRCWGYVDRKFIVGKAWIIYWSWDWPQGKGIERVRFERIGTLLN
jgi:signal peptidase I